MRARRDSWSCDLTIGNTFLTERERGEIPGAVLQHERKHSDQWALLGPVIFPVAYGIDALLARRNGVVDPCHQIFERWAGLADGGYSC